MPGSLIFAFLAAAWLAFSLGHRQFTLRITIALRSDGKVFVSPGLLHTVTTAMTQSHQVSMSCWFPRLLKLSAESEGNVTLYLFAVVLQTSVELHTVDATSTDFFRSRKLQKVDVDFPDTVVGAN